MMGLFKPEWQNKDSHKAEAAAKKVEDPKELVRMVLKANSLFVQNIALEKINDQALLEYVVEHTESGRVRAAAVRKLSNTSLLTSFMADANADSRVRIAAIETHPNPDQALLHTILSDKSDRDPHLRIAAMRRLKDRAVLEQIVYDESPSARSDSYVNDQIRDAAIENIRNQDVLMRILEDFAARKLELSNAMALTAVKNIFNQKKLTEIALGGLKGTRDTLGLVEVAISRLADIEVLRKIYNEQYWKNIYPNPGEFAARRLRELGVSVTGYA